jgi:hypothetical protein
VRGAPAARWQAERVLPLVVAALLATALRSGAPGVAVDRTVTDPRIPEASGLVISPDHPGVLWTHNDSGNPPRLYALRPDGSVAAAVWIRGTADLDWEALATYRDAGGRPILAVGDIGDNAADRRTVQVVLLPEPQLRTASVTPSRVLTLRYPDGPVDAETLLIDAGPGPSSAWRMYVVSKGLGSTVYEVPPEVWPGRPGTVPSDRGTLRRIATVPLVLVTDGVIGPGHHPLLRTYGVVAVLPPVTSVAPGGSLDPIAVAPLPAQRQGEGLALADPRTVLLNSEGVGQPVLRMTLPAALTTPLADSPAGPGNTVRPTRPVAAPTGRTAATLLGLGAATVLAAAVAGVRLRRRRIRPVARPRGRRSG